MGIFNIPEGNEKWKDIKGFEGLYQVSNLGRVKHLKSVTSDNKRIPERLLTPTGSRYKSVALHKGGKFENRLVHRLVAEAFIPNPDNLPEVNHKDSDITNNQADNLEWVTASANHSHGVEHRKNYSYRVSVKCLETNEIFASISAAGRSVNADATQIVESIEAQRCCKGYTFAYMDRLPENVNEYVKQAHNKYQTFHKRPRMRNAKKVRSIETGEEFDSIAAAARFYKCDASTIVDRISGHRTVGGITLEYVEEKA